MALPDGRQTKGKLLRGWVDHLLEKLLELAHSRITHEHIESSKGFHGFGYELPPRLGLCYVSCNEDESAAALLTVVIGPDNLRYVFAHRFDEGLFFGSAEVVYGYFCAVAEVFESDGLKRRSC